MVTEAGLEAWLDAEDVRRTDELDRRAAEALRITAEAARLDAEADRASLYATVKEAYDSGELDGESGSITLLDMVIEPPLTQPYFEEAEDSTEARRVYTPHFPTGAVMYASLHINAQDRTLYMRAPAPYVGPTFRLNHTTRNLEVVLNANE